MSKQSFLGLLVAGAGSTLVAPVFAQTTPATPVSANVNVQATPPSAGLPTAPAAATPGVEPTPPPAPPMEAGSAPLTPEAPASGTGVEAEVNTALPPSPETVAAPAAEGASATSAEEAAALAALMGGETESTEAAMDEYNLNFYGFADFGIQRLFFDSFDGYPSTFMVGRLNMYFGGELGDNWRTLSEVRFSFLPNGTTPAGTDPFAVTPTPPTNTTVPDYVDYDRPKRYGSIILERVWLEKTVEPWLNIRLGYWLTPYGIWNVDHGSPVILGVTRPYAVGESLFPEAQTGFEVYGSYGFGAANIGYELTLSNGRGPFDTTKDLDKNKAVGWRLQGSYDSDIGIFSIGYSGYLGDYTEGTMAFGLMPDGTFGNVFTKNVYFQEMGTAFDFKWTLGGASLQSEFIMQDVQQKDRRLQAATVFSPAGNAPDYRRLGVYGIAAYRIDSLLGLTPWIGTEYYNTGKHPGSFFADGVNELYAGINLRPTPRVVLKTQYVGVFFKGDVPRSDIFNAQATWSF